MPSDTVTGALLTHAEQRPDSIFSVFVSRTEVEAITFADLLERSAAYATYYQRSGLQRGDVVIVTLQHTPHLYYSYLGAILANAVPSFMPFPTPKQRTDIYWNDHLRLYDRIQAKALVTYDELANKIDGLRTIVAGNTILTEGLANPRPEEWSASQNAIACLQHSSGTTELKKGVALTHGAILRQVKAYSERLGFGDGESIASWLPLYHDMGFIACFMTSVICGATLIALDPFEWVMRPAILLDAIERYSATFTWLPNFAFSHIANSVPFERYWDLSSVRAFINCSEPCKPRTFERFLDRFQSCGVRPESLQVCYAMAENVFGVTQSSIGSPPRVLNADAAAFSKGVAREHGSSRDVVQILSCGQPIEGVDIAIRDASGNKIDNGVIGEIAVTSPFLFSEYYRQPEKTAEKLRDGWYSTGDLGFMLDGELYVTGRIDDMIILNGRNYYAHEIEHVANDVPGIMPGRNVAIAVEDARTDSTVVVLLAECERGADIARIGRAARQAVLERLGLSLYEFKALPSGQLVKTTSGKISRSKNKELYLSNTFTPYEACPTPTKS